MKERWAILCTSRLLIFKRKLDERGPIESSHALAVYPLIDAQFELKSGELLELKNFKN